MQEQHATSECMFVATSRRMRGVQQKLDAATVSNWSMEVAMQYPLALSDGMGLGGGVGWGRMGGRGRREAPGATLSAFVSNEYLGQGLGAA